MTRATSRAHRLNATWQLLLDYPDGLSCSEIAARLGVVRQTTWRDVRDLGAVVASGFGSTTLWTYRPTSDDIALARRILMRARGTKPVRPRKKRRRPARR